jgi:hypothetical protein
MWADEGGGRQVTAAETETRGSRPGELHRRRVLLLGESAGLAAVLHHLLDPADRLSRIGSLRELTETRALESADVVVLDVPAGNRAGAVDQIRRSYLGPLVVLVARGEDTGWLHVDDAATLLARPFSAEELGAALARRGGSLPAGPWMPEPVDPRDRLRSPAGGPGAGSGASDTVPVPVTRRRRLGVAERLRRLLPGVSGGLTGRRVRVAGFSAFTLVAFTVAFALAAHGRCGPGCDALGIGFSPAPKNNARSGSPAPSTTGPKRAPFSTAAGAAVNTGAFQSASSGRQATSTTAERQVTTTTRRPNPGGGGPGSTTPTTRPATTTPTTAPPTTQPVTTPPTTTPTPTTAGP